MYSIVLEIFIMFEIINWSHCLDSKYSGFVFMMLLQCCVFTKG